MHNDTEANDEQKRIDDTYANEFILFKNEKDKNETIDFLLNYRRKSFILSNDLARISTLILFASVLYGASINLPFASDKIILCAIFSIFIYVMANDIYVTAFTYLYSIKKFRNWFRNFLEKYYSSKIRRIFTNIAILSLPFGANAFLIWYRGISETIAQYSLHIMFILVTIAVCILMYKYHKRNEHRQYFRLMGIVFITNIVITFMDVLIPLTFNTLFHVIKAITAQTLIIFLATP